LVGPACRAGLSPQANLFARSRTIQSDNHRDFHQRTAAMNFEELTAVLSKGSATAVATLESNVAELNVLKEYLYVQTPVEQALRSEIDRNLNSPSDQQVSTGATYGRKT
jgi:hypothetical protein